MPPFWETDWFRVLLILGATAGVAGLYLLRMQSIQARRRALETQVKNRTKELAALNAIASVVSQTLDLEQILAGALEQTLEVTGLEAGGIYLAQGEPDDQGAEILTLTAHQGLDLDLVAGIDNLMFGAGFSGRVVRSREPMIVYDLCRDDRLSRSVVTEKGFRSIAIVPLISRARALGTLFVMSRHRTEFAPEDVALLIAIGGQVGMATENARLHEAERRRAEQSRLISEAGQRMTSILDVDELLREIVAAIQNAFGYYVVGIGLVEGDELVVVVAEGLGAEDAGDSPLRVTLGERSVVGWVAASGQPLLVPDVKQEPRYLQWPATARTQSELAVPLQTQTGVIGVLNVESDEVNAFDESDVVMLQSLANQAAVAIENARLFEAEQRRAEQFRVIAETGRRLTVLLDIEEVLQQVVRLVQETFGYYHVGIGLIEGDELVYRVGAGAPWDDPQFDFRPAGLKIGEEGLSGWVAATGETLLVPDVRCEPRYVWMEGSQTRSELVVPISVKGEVIGVLDAQSDRLNAFDDTDRAVLQALAHQAAAALENARLYEQAQHAAVIEERQRLARDLHDAVTQTLFSAGLIAEAVPETIEIDQNEGLALLQELQRLTRGALAEMRTLLLELRPTALVETDLPDLLRQLAEAASGREGLPIHVEVEGLCRLPPDLHVALYRIVQEALNNVVKHAHASRATVHLTCTPSPAVPQEDPALLPRSGYVELRVADDGRGFDPTRVGADHLGLGIMRERAEAVGAQLRVRSERGVGTEVVLAWNGDYGPASIQ